MSVGWISPAIHQLATPDFNKEPDQTQFLELMPRQRSICLHDSWLPPRERRPTPPPQTHHPGSFFQHPPADRTRSLAPQSSHMHMMGINAA